MIYKKEVKDFVNGNVDIIFLEAKWGTGKTHYFITPLIQSLVDINMNVRILIITENNNLNSEFKLKYDKYNFVSHTDTKNLCDYDSRIRGSSIETNKDDARQLINKLIIKLNDIQENRNYENIISNV